MIFSILLAFLALSTLGYHGLTKDVLKSNMDGPVRWATALILTAAYASSTNAIISKMVEVV